MSALDALLDELADRVAERVAARLHAGTGMIDQSASPLGRRRHMAAVRRLAASGATGAAIVGRRHLLSRTALDAELALQSAKPKRARAPVATPVAPADQLAELRERYSLEKAG